MHPVAAAITLVGMLAWFYVLRTGAGERARVAARRWVLRMFGIEDDDA